LFINSSIYSLTHPCIAQKSNFTIIGARQQTLRLKSGCVRPIKRSGRLLATFKETNPNIEVPTVDLTCDEQARTIGTVLGELARAVGILIREPVRTTRMSERVITPTAEKGIQRMEAKKKGKDLHDNLDVLCWLCVMKNNLFEL
jgi:hypothetical protein